MIKPKPATKATKAASDDLAIPAFLKGVGKTNGKLAAAAKPATSPAKPIAPSDEQMAAVEMFAANHAKAKGGWKQLLLTKWMNGSDDKEPQGHLLRQVRNQFGPKWLAATKAIKANPAPAAKPAVVVGNGGKVNGSAPAGAPGTPEALLAAAKAQTKAAKPTKSPKDLAKAVKAHGKKFAHKNGWDLFLLQSDAEIEAAVTGLTSKAAAVKKCRTIAQGLDKKRPAKKA